MVGVVLGQQVSFLAYPGTLGNSAPSVVAAARAENEGCLPKLSK
jgi:hypothetical protein